MIGDTNLFFVNMEDRLCAEAEIMIAESWARNKKCGSEAMVLMFLYGIETLGVKQFVVKISQNNDISINMFKNWGFIEISYSGVFQEFTLSKIVDDNWTLWLKSTVGLYTIESDKIVPA